MDGMNYSTVPVPLQFKFVLLSDTLIAFLTIFSSVYPDYIYFLLSEYETNVYWVQDEQYI